MKYFKKVASLSLALYHTVAFGRQRYAITKYVMRVLHVLVEFRVQLRMSGNKLKLNPDKTEFLLIGHKRQRIKYLAMFPVDLLGLQTTSAKAARKLGVVFDTNFSFRSHVSAVCRSCRYHIRDLRRICRYLSFDSAKLLAHALVCSRLDYCNSILFGIADKETI